MSQMPEFHPNRDLSAQRPTGSAGSVEAPVYNVPANSFRQYPPPRLLGLDPFLEAKSLRQRLATDLLNILTANPELVQGGVQGATWKDLPEMAEKCLEAAGRIYPEPAAAEGAQAVIQGPEDLSDGPGFGSIDTWDGFGLAGLASRSTAADTAIADHEAEKDRGPRWNGDEDAPSSGKISGPLALSETHTETRGEGMVYEIPVPAWSGDGVTRRRAEDFEVEGRTYTDVDSTKEGE